MPSASFERSIRVGAPAEVCWPVLTDVDRIAGWVSLISGVVELEHLSSYEAVLADRFGMFNLKADLSVKVVELEEGHRIRFHAEGRDRHVNTHISVEAELQLDPTEDGTSIHVSGEYKVLGTVATMGASTIQKKAEMILEEFFGAAERSLATL